MKGHKFHNTDLDDMEKEIKQSISAFDKKTKKGKGKNMKIIDVKDFDKFDDVMSIEGGIMLYYGSERDDGRYGEGFCEGEKVYFSDKNGGDYDREQAAKILQIGEVLTVSEIYVDSWSSKVEFKEYPGKQFNTVMFNKSGREDTP